MWRIDVNESDSRLMIIGKSAADDKSALRIDEESELLQLPNTHDGGACAASRKVQRDQGARGIGEVGGAPGFAKAEPRF